MVRVRGGARLELGYSDGTYHMKLTHIEDGQEVISHWYGRIDELTEIAEEEGFYLTGDDFLQVYAPVLWPTPDYGMAEYTALLHPVLKVYYIGRGIAPDGKDLFAKLDHLKPVTHELLPSVATLFTDLVKWDDGDWAVSRGVGAA